MMNRLILILGLLIFNAGLLATERVYQADVEGMVCAFCAYSVSRDVAGLPGVNSASVDVDLENGKVTFSSSVPVSEKELFSVFADSGFRVSGLREADPGKAVDSDDDYQLALELSFNQNNLSAHVVSRLKGS
jgi:copper chaperone CopZ